VTLRLGLSQVLHAGSDLRSLLDEPAAGDLGKRGCV